MAQVNLYTSDVCPFDPWKLLFARDVIAWAFNEIDDVSTNANSAEIYEALDDCIMKEVIRGCRIRRLEDYTIDELKIEIESRFENNEQYDNRTESDDL